MKSRTLLYWTISIATLLLCLFLPNNFFKSSTSEPLLVSSSLKVEPGHITYYDSKFHASFGGQLIMEVNRDGLDFNPDDYNVVIVDELEMDFTTQLSLHWTIDDQPYSQILNHGTQSITPIEFHTSQAEKIEDLHFLLRTDFELNTQPSMSKTVTFNSIYFNDIKNLSTWQSNLAQWFSFKPVEVNSINGITNPDNLLYQGLIYRLIIWLIAATLFYFLLRVNGAHLVANIAIAWILTALPLLANTLKQHQQLTLAYPDSESFINSQDKRIFQLASLIKSELNKLPEVEEQPHKFIILGSNSFENLRLFFHLTELNVGISTYVNRIDNENQKHLVYILTEQDMAICNDPEADMWSNNQFSLLLKHKDFCLVKTK